MADRLAETLLKNLQEPAAVFAPLCLDPLTARLAEQVGFRFGYLSGGALGYSYAVSEALLAKDAATYPFNVCLKDSHQYAPNPLLLWEALMACVERGVSLLDMGESSEGSSVYRFKKNFGGSIEPS